MAEPITVAWDLRAQLGEGPVWHAQSASFFFVDIHGCKLHAWDPVRGTRRSWDAPERLCWVIPRRDGDGWLAGRQSGFYRMEIEGDALRWQYLPSAHPMQTDLRLNDAKADPWGRVWAGSMNNEDPSRADGALYCVEGDGRIRCVERGIHIPNGPAIAPDGRWLLHTDSWLNTVYRYDLDAAGRLGNKSVWRVLAGADGTPDGMEFDAAGCVWIAFWDGACVRRFRADGTLDKTVHLPARRITSLAFGGSDGCTVCATSAAHGLDTTGPGGTQAHGALFSWRASVAGLAPCTWG